MSVAARTICRQYPAAEVSAAVGVVMALKASGVAVAQRLTTPDEPITSATKARTGAALDSGALYEVVQLAGEWCLRIRTSGQPIAWSLTNDAAFQSYCREQMKGET